MSFPTRFVFGRLFFSLLLTALILLPLTCSAKLGDIMINAISHNVEKEEVEVVEFWLSGDITPNTFMIPGENPRLVIDFFSTGYSGPTRIESPTPNLVQRIRIGFHNNPEPKTRVVIDLLPNRGIDWEKNFIHHNNTLRFTFKPKAIKLSAAEPPAPSSQILVFKAASSKIKKELALKSAEMAAANVSADGKNAPQRSVSAPKKGPDRSILQEVTFDDLQVRNGEMVLFKVKNFSPPTISAHEKGKPRVICDFNNAIIDENIAPRIETQGKFVNSIDVGTHEKNMARVVLNLNPGKDYDLQQVFFQEDKLFVLIVSDLAFKQ